MKKNFRFTPYPDRVEVVLQDCEIVLETEDPSCEGSYYLTLYIEGEGGRIPYEYGYVPWGCAPCGVHTYCWECGGCSGTPSLPAKDVIIGLILWIENELKNNRRIRIQIFPKKA